ncbi:flagellar biosynthesis protein FlhF [Paenibacillus sp. J5C_2022]|uniref:flagellar biosynthesis protein FlhF n=1 Tax=Paenibacillus sp. J5C2022 TaxID=2977129 RepID=UPI0021D15EE3|nr:flagellar biosynthesis protein FlhF [Paenibacillus sp. J5C2022]MCU6707120.1 flagellar biosynthesis protein FlhF [Paenibacillus sp. J5C2022]
MRMKRYIVNALPEAVAMIRTDLGHDAVILETKQIHVGGFMGMFRKKKMEVIAAVEGGAGKAPAKPKQVPAPEVGAALQQLLLQSSKGTAAAVSPAAASEAESAPVAHNVSRPTESSPAKPASLKEEKEQFIINEIRELRDYMKKLSKSGAFAQTYSESIAALQNRLLEQEVEQRWIDELAEALQQEEQSRGEILTQREAWALAYDWFSAKLKPFTNEGIREDTRVIQFVGPTGVGKTTSIAKLAAEQSIKHGRKIGFITSDTYRIAAVEQLRTYANILDAPMEVVFSPADLTKAYKALEDRDLILMDTAGRNYRSELHVSEVNSLLHSSEQSEIILVLSLTGKFKDMTLLADRFKKYGIRKAIFTKCDETVVYGAIFNLVMEYELLPTHIASGQTVPDDIAPFHSKSYVEMLLGEADHE